MDGNLLEMTAPIERINIVTTPTEQRANEGPFFGRDGICGYCARFYFISAYHYMERKNTQNYRFPESNNSISEKQTGICDLDF